MTDDDGIDSFGANAKHLADSTRLEVQSPHQIPAATEVEVVGHSRADDDSQTRVENPDRATLRDQSDDAHRLKGRRACELTQIRMALEAFLNQSSPLGTSAVDLLVQLVDRAMLTHRIDEVVSLAVEHMDAFTVNAFGWLDHEALGQELEKEGMPVVSFAQQLPVDSPPRWRIQDGEQLRYRNPQRHAIGVEERLVVGQATCLLRIESMLERNELLLAHVPGCLRDRTPRIGETQHEAFLGKKPLSSVQPGYPKIDAQWIHGVASRSDAALARDSQ
jgi:hypothetical protein